MEYPKIGVYVGMPFRCRCDGSFLLVAKAVPVVSLIAGRLELLVASVFCRWGAVAHAWCLPALSGNRSPMPCMFLRLQLWRFSPMDHQLAEYYAKVQSVFLSFCLAKSLHSFSLATFSHSFSLATEDIHLLAFLFVFSRNGSTNGIFFRSMIDYWSICSALLFFTLRLDILILLSDCQWWLHPKASRSMYLHLPLLLIQILKVITCLINICKVHVL